jgi:hypothetical protein
MSNVSPDLVNLIKITYSANDPTKIEQLYCTATNCPWAATPAWYPKDEKYDKYRTNAKAWDSQIVRHTSQHAPGKAPDLTDVEYELSWTVDCTVCPRGDGDVVIEEYSGSKTPQGLKCLTCGTTWDSDGDGGELKKPEPGDDNYIDPNQLTLNGIA